MKRTGSLSIRTMGVFLAAMALMASLAPASATTNAKTSHTKTSARPDKRADARLQFEQAIKMRTMLEGYLVADRSIADYKKTVGAYHKVYLISPQSEDVTPALIAEAELEEEMGRQYDPKYFKTSIDTYNFLLKQYPGTRYKSAIIFAIGKIQKDDLKKPDEAEATFKEFLRRFPKSDKAGGARQALIEIAQQRNNGAKREKVEQVAVTDGLEKSKSVEPRVSDNHTPSVTDIRTSNSDDYSRIVVMLDDTIKYDSAHIRAPDRVYFDIYKAKVSPALVHKTWEVQNGLLKSLRVAQNREGVVRVVLDVDGAQDYSAFLLANPYRLVIDVHAQPAATTAKREADPAAAAPLEAKSESDETATASAEKRAPEAAAPGSKTTAKPAAANAAMAGKSKTEKPKTAVALRPPTEPKLNRDGQRSLTRELGLKISRIVIDPGHGGHDTGTIGPHGLMEKDLCLDIALRLGRMIEDKLPNAQVVYTRKDDTFIPLEDRTAIANNAKADLFISIHANSSHDQAARGIETYYLNFATSPESMEVATRENALSQSSIHDLQDLVKKIARNEKIEESKELANDVQDSLAHRMQVISQNQRNRGVKKAPFVVLIGANMPSILSEISFISNPADEKLLKSNYQRQRVAEGLYRGITSYLDSLNSLSYNKQKLVSDNHTGPSDGNIK
ncbi:MAG TPA: N-acetylmuramoyl-L-alanine amidase [Candidatus Angelobacter sp.]|nr:N-acetylmuramoyl-L-alanine amidase [Candidatus Angelobacter sp.]